MQSAGMRLQNDASPELPTRGSVRSRLAAEATALTLRPLTTVIPANRLGVRAARRIVATSLALLGPALSGSRILPVAGSPEKLGAGPSARGEWVRGPGATRDDAVILYIHGSAYTLCSARTHRGITTRLSALTGLPVFACDYRLAPHHRFPAAAEDVLAAYEWLVGEGHDPARIVVVGDSAGGQLAVDLALELIRERRPAPAALVAFSPVLDVSMSMAASRERMRPDPMISAERAARLLRLYFGRGGRPDIRLKLSQADAGTFPPTLIQAGAREMLAADAIELARAIETAGASCRLEVWPDQMHVFQALPRLLPEAEVALGRAAAFIADAA